VKRGFPWTMLAAAGSWPEQENGLKADAESLATEAISRLPEGEHMLEKSLQQRRKEVRLQSEPQVEELHLLPASAEITAEGSPPPPGGPHSIAAGVASAFSIVRKVSQRVSVGKKPGESFK